MRARYQTAGLWILAAACLTLGGCAKTGAPEGWLPVAERAPREAYGAWVTVEFVKTHHLRYLGGEFIAVDIDSLYVLVTDGGLGGPVTGVPLGLVRKARIAHFDPETGKASGWVAAGTISTLSHGLGAGISMPLWLIIGGTLAGGQSYSALEDYPASNWHELRMYARFPQGAPPGLNEMVLRQKIR